MVYAPNKGQNINIMFAPAALINIQIPSGLFLYLNATYAPNSKPKPSRHLSYGYACCAHQYTNTRRTLLSLLLLFITQRNIYLKHQIQKFKLERRCGGSKIPAPTPHVFCFTLLFKYYIQRLEHSYTYVKRKYRDPYI